MRPLEGMVVLAPGDMAARPLGRLLATLGAQVLSGDPDSGRVAAADFLIESVGIDALAQTGITRDRLEAWNPALVHVSVTPRNNFG